MNRCQVVSAWTPWTNAAVILTALGAFVFVVSYAWMTRGGWRKNSMGVNMMAFMGAIAIVTSLAVTTIVWGVNWPGREIIRLLCWGSIGALIWWRVIILYRVQHERHRHHYVTH